jgi:hypothetical protein
MKKVLLGLMVLGSLTAFADDQSFVGEHGEKETVCAPCEAAKEARLKQSREAGKDLEVSGTQTKSSGKGSASKQ